MKLFKGFAVLIVLFILAILIFGSRPDKFESNGVIQPVQMSLTSMDQYISDHESQYDIRLGNEAKIIWADSIKTKTPYSLVYLHGFSASHKEGDPVHRALAKRYGMNLYLSRLSEHGLNKKDPLGEMKADELVESAKEAIQIGSQIGEKVIVIGTSTGATLAIYLAASNPELIDVLLFFAPNINVADPRSFLLTYPGGGQLAEFLEGDFLSQGMSGVEFDKYWYPQYKTSSVVELLSLVENTMTEDVFARVFQPTFVSFYYKNEQEKDQIISTDHIYDFYDDLGTSSDKKQLITSPNSGNHVTISDITSKDIISPYRHACKFLEEVCGIHAVNSTAAEDVLFRR